MVYESTLIFETNRPIPFTVANATGIEKGTLLKLTDDMTAVISTGGGDMIAGISASEKIASDGNVNLGVYRRGIFKMYASGSITAGDPVKPETGVAAFRNHVETATGDITCSGSNIIGLALGDATNAQTVLIDLNIGVGGACAVT